MKRFFLNITIMVTLIAVTSCSSNNNQNLNQAKKVAIVEDNPIATTSPNTELVKAVTPSSKLEAEVNKAMETTPSKALEKKPIETIPSKAPVKKPEPTPSQLEVKKPVIKPTPNNVQVKGNEDNVVKGRNKIIVIDPGHANKSNLKKEALAPGSSEMKIMDGGGAQGISTKTPEYLVNMKVAVKLKTLLETNGFKVVMTKTDNSLSLGNIERANIGNNANARLVIRIHADSSDNSSVVGASMLVPAGINENTKAIHDESKRSGTIVLNTLASKVGMKNRGVIEHIDMTGFNWSKVPVILVEMGFLSNVNEDKLLSSDDYQNKLALGLFHGIVAATLGNN